jgi:hypothetical protein
MRRALALLPLLGACLNEPSFGLPPECATTPDCPSGLECRSGNCFGPPPALDFASVIIPPSDRDDLAIAEMETLHISDRGEATLEFGAAATASGRVLLHTGDPVSIAGRVTFERPSRIPGAAAISVEVHADDGRPGGQAAYRATLAPTRGDEAYALTVVPDDAALAPPLALSLPVPADVKQELALVDSLGLKLLSGRVIDAANRGMEGMRITAYGRRVTGGEIKLASSVAVTDSLGRFELKLPVAWENTFDIVCAPAANVRAPTMRRRSVLVPDGAVGPDLELRYPSYPRPIRYGLPLAGPDKAGGKKPADGAKVTMRTMLSSPTGDEVTYESQATSDSSGVAQVWLVPGGTENRVYTLDVVPLPNAAHSAVWGQTVLLGPPSSGSEDGGILAEVLLPSRAYITGRVLDVKGVPVADVQVRPQLSPYFTNSVSPEVRAQAAALGLPQDVTTDPNGGFALYLDPKVGPENASYDLDLIPPSGSRLPRWSRDRITPVVSEAAQALGDLTLPKGVLASSVVRDIGGDPVPDVEVRVYVRGIDLAVCAGVAPGCVPPARLRALAKSNSNGYVVLVLPSP